MALYSVSYQLNAPTKDYQPLWDAFAELGAHKAMRDFYLVDNSASTNQLGSYLRSFIDENDFLFVTPFVSKPYKTGCYTGTQAWIDERF